MRALYYLSIVALFTVLIYAHPLLCPDHGGGRGL